jgi:hypothetical protein
VTQAAPAVRRSRWTRGLRNGERRGVVEDENYWQRLAAHRLSRRRLLTGAAGMGAGLAAASLAGCGDGGDEAESTPGASLPAVATPQTAARPRALEPAKTRGGRLRWFSWYAMPLDTIDPHQSQLGPLFAVHAATFSKVLQYDEPYEGVIGVDLRRRCPKRPTGRHSSSR